MKSKLVILYIITSCLCGCGNHYNHSKPSFKGRKEDTSEIWLQVIQNNGGVSLPFKATKLILDTIQQVYDTNAYTFNKFIDSGYKVFYKHDTLRDAKTGKPFYDSIQKKYITYPDTTILYNFRQVIVLPANAYPKK